MKKLIMVAMALAIVCSASFADDDLKEIRKERQELRKMAKKELSAKVDKAVKKEAKRLKKEGWMPAAGSLPIEKQLERSYMMEYEFDEDLYPKYIMGSAQSIGGNLDAAKMQATTLAITDIAGKIQTEVAALIESTVANNQMDKDEAASLTESVMASKNLISQSIARTLPVIELSRTLPNKNKEVMIRLAYSGDMAKAAAKKAVRQTMEEKGQKLHDQLDKALGF